jgi:hypothetical protein
LKLSRHQLYALVWQKPITKLAKEFGMSDVGFAKICRKHGIPLPERGYWARVDAGQTPPKKALTRKDYNPEIVIVEREPVTEEILMQRKLNKKKQAEALAQVGTFIVPNALNKPHKLTLMTQRYFQDIERKLIRESKVKDKYRLDWKDRAPSAEYGRYFCRGTEGFSLKVSLEKLNRALCFLDALVKVLERHGFEIQNNIKGHRGQITVEATKDEEGVRFHLQEGYSQRLLSEKELELERSVYSYASQFGRAPSGIFTFSVCGRQDWYDKKFVDSSKKIEERLSEIVTEFIDLVPRQKQERIAKAKAEDEARERARIRELEQRKREERIKQFEDALGEAEKLNRLEQLEIYLQRVEEQYIGEYGKIEGNVAEWFSIVRTLAQSTNPLANRLFYLRKLTEDDD